METAGDGGPYGMALLASYLIHKENGESLEDYLDNKVFKSAKTTSLEASKEEVDGFNQFIEDYKNCLSVEKEAIPKF